MVDPIVQLLNQFRHVTRREAFDVAGETTSVEPATARSAIPTREVVFSQRVADREIETRER
jgi:hypothetical protein